MSVPDLAEPIHAWRAMLPTDDGRLRGVIVVWPRPQLRARCLSSAIAAMTETLLGRRSTHKHQPPCPLDGPDHARHGIYAWKTRQQACDHLQKGFWRGGVPVECLLWGTVVEHEFGWRATHARLTRVHRRDGGWDTNVVEAADNYGLELVHTREARLVDGEAR